MLGAGSVLVLAKCGEARVPCLVLREVVGTVRAITQELVHLRHEVLALVVLVVGHLLAPALLGGLLGRLRFGVVRIEVWILTAAPRGLLHLILWVLELLLVARLAHLLSLAMLALGVAELLLDVGNQALLRGLVMVRVDHGVDGAHVVLLAALPLLLAVEIVAAARREQIAIAAATLLVVELRLEGRVDEDLRLGVDVVLVVSRRIGSAPILNTDNSIESESLISDIISLSS